jgi:hypothetical protein
MLSDTKRQVINLWNSCIWLVNLFELYNDAPTCQRQKYKKRVCMFSESISNFSRLRHSLGCRVLAPCQWCGYRLSCYAACHTCIRFVCIWQAIRQLGLGLRWTLGSNPFVRCVNDNRPEVAMYAAEYRSTSVDTGQKPTFVFLDHWPLISVKEFVNKMDVCVIFIRE